MFIGIAIYKKGGIILRTSALICKMFKNEGSMEISKIDYYIKELLKMGFLEIDKDGTSLKLTEKGLKYADKE